MGTTTLLNTTDLVIFEIPNWVYEKIYPVFAAVRVERLNFVMTDDGWNTQNLNVTLTKLGNNKLSMQVTGGDVLLTSAKAFRLAFDLLIDNE